MSPERPLTRVPGLSMVCCDPAAHVTALFSPVGAVGDILRMITKTPGSLSGRHVTGTISVSAYT